jgi:hypothetical protein
MRSDPCWCPPCWAFATVVKREVEYFRIAGLDPPESAAPR